MTADQIAGDIVACQVDAVRERIFQELIDRKFSAAAISMAAPKIECVLEGIRAAQTPIVLSQVLLHNALTKSKEGQGHG